MKAFTGTVNSEKEKLASIEFNLIKLGTDGYTDCDRILTYNGITYMPWPINISGLESGDMNLSDAGDIALSDSNYEFSKKVIKTEFNDITVEVNTAYLNAAGEIIGVELLFSGYVNGQSIANSWLKLSLITHRHSWDSESPPRKVIANCGWLFKGTECAYTGSAQWCDKTYAFCTLLANTTNFGGFRHIPQYDVELVWGGVTEDGKRPYF